MTVSQSRPHPVSPLSCSPSSRQCLLVAIRLPKAARLRRKPCSLGSATTNRAGSGVPSQHRSPMPRNSPRSLEVNAPFHPQLSLTYATHSCLLDRGYTSIVEMTDEDGVEERYRPTKANLVRPPPDLAPDPHALTVPSFRSAK